MSRDIDRRIAKVAREVDGVPVAAAVFTPNIAYGPRVGVPGLIAVVADWRREDRAIRDGGGLVPRTLLVVTARDVYAFDAGLLAWNVVHVLARWPRADLVARAVPVAGPTPPEWITLGFRPPPSLRLENTAGNLLAELRPSGWGAAQKRVLAELGVPG